MRMQQEWMRQVANYRMPFGKYEGKRILDLPEEYIIWFRQKGFPEGELGTVMSAVYDIKLNGLERLFDPYRR